MLASVEGDAAAHAALLTELAAVLRMHIRRNLGVAQADVEDLVQEALIAVHLRREHYDPSRAFLPWVFAIARYKWIDRIRQQRLASGLDLEEAWDLACPDAAEQTCASLDLQNLLAELPQRQREAIESTKLEGLSIAETAMRFGISQSAVKVYVHRGIKALVANVQRAVRAYG
jgi:RNA polymerase sigma-70 factor (ECF subfamily)